MTERADQDLVLWRQWDAQGRKPDDLEPLLDKFEPVIHTQLRRYAGHVNVPEPTIHADLENRFIQALQSFDPNRGAQLATHVNWHLKGVHGFVAQHQNIARIPENQLSRIKDLTAAIHEAQEELGKVPDNAALASKLHWSPTQVGKLRRSLRKDLLAPQFEVPIGAIAPSRWESMKSLLPAELSPQEKFVFEHTTGAGGAPIMQAQQMAKKLRMSNAGISRLRASVAKRLESYGVTGPVGVRAITAFGDTDGESEED
jgi:hypothetical protein